MSLSEFMRIDTFTNADDYIIHQLSLNKGSQSCITKKKLIELAEEKGIAVYSSDSKRELAKVMYKVMGKELLRHCKHIGISEFSFMMKFALLPGEVEAFAKAGLLEITGNLSICKDGKSKPINLYSAEQYFSLDDKTISEWRGKVSGE